jgi:hypothetical protein
LVEKVAGYELDLVLKVLNTFEVDGTAAADQPKNPIVLFEEKLCEIGTILAGDSGNEGFSLHL